MEVYLLCLVCAGLLGASPGIGAEKCDPEWRLSPDGESCLFISGADDELDFEAAELECEAREGMLASLSDKEDWEFFVELIQNDDSKRQGCEGDPSPADCEPIRDFWIGLKRYFLEEEELHLHERRMGWHWLDKTPYTYRDSASNWVRSAWNIGRPNVEPTGDSKCARIKMSGQLADIRCDTILRYICEKGLGTTVSAQDVTMAPPNAAANSSVSSMVRLPLGEEVTPSGETPVVVHTAENNSSEPKTGELALYTIPVAVVILAVVIGVPVGILIKKRRKKTNFKNRPTANGTLNNLNIPTSNGMAMLYDNNLVHDNLPDDAKRYASYEVEEVNGERGEVDIDPEKGNGFGQDGVVLKKYDNAYVNDENVYVAVPAVAEREDDTVPEYFYDRIMDTSKNPNEHIYEHPNDCNTALGIIGTGSGSVLSSDPTDHKSDSPENNVLTTDWTSSDTNDDGGGTASLLSRASESTSSDHEDTCAMPQRRTKKVTFVEPPGETTAVDKPGDEE